MKYKTFKKFDTKDYKEIYTKEKKPHIEISIENETYCMDLSAFIKDIKKSFYTEENLC